MYEVIVRCGASGGKSSPEAAYSQRMTALMPNHDPAQPAPLAVTEVPNLRAVPLNQLADLAEAMLRRTIPAEGAAKAPVAAFDASL